MEKEKNKKKQIAKISVFITSLFVIFMSVTYAFINLTLTGEKKQVITAGNLDLELKEDENNITITNAMPMYDEVGMIQDPFTFKLINKTANDTNYILKLVKIPTANELESSIVKYGLTKDEKKSSALLSTLSDGIVDSGTIAGNQTIDYTLRLWIYSGVTDNTQIEGKSLSYRIDVEASQKIEWVADFGTDNSNANQPELTSGMIPVVYNEIEKSWVKADTTQNKYYNYENQQWANAVTVTETNRATYMNAEVGTPISMDDINTMWVWIPRYEYQYTDLGTSYAGGTQAQPGEIKINFISKDATTPSDTNTYKIPEGFTFGNENLPGFWMAKFETTGSMSAACTSEDCTTADVTVKPNLSSLSDQTVSSKFYASRSMQNSTNANKYGFATTGMDVHMLKNSEWGIVAMLSQSKYGKYGNPNYTGANKEVAINNCNKHITGIGGDTVSASPSSTTCTTNTYETEKGQAASTTGNVTGVYDMSGGAYEYVMGNYNQISGLSSYYNANSGFCGTNGPTSGCLEWPDSKYYDLYTTDDASKGYKQGDATYETSGWYSDDSYFVDSDFPWFNRGGYHFSNSGNTGVFFSFGDEGSAMDSFRLAIKP